MNKKSFNFIVCVIVLSMVVLSASVILGKNIQKTEFHKDETGAVTSAYYYADLLLRFDFDLQKWQAKHLNRFGSLLSLHLGQVLTGIPLKWYSLQSGREYSNLYDSSKSLEENKKAGNIPPQDILLFARTASAFWGILCCILALAIGYYSRNIWVGWLAATLLMTNKLFIQCSTRAMTDIYYLFFLLSACLLLTILIKQKKSTLTVAFLYGIVAGLAASIKLIGLAPLGLLLLAYFVCQAFTETKEKKTVLIGMTVFCFTALSVVCVLNPYLWDINHPGKLLLLFKSWIEVNSRHAIDNAYRWENNRLWIFHKFLLWKYKNFSYEWLFLFSGIILSTVMLARSLQAKRFDHRLIPFLFFVANYTFILLFMTVNWDRYYLPTVSAKQFVIAGAIYEAGIFLYRYIFDNKSIKLWRLNNS